MNIWLQGGPCSQLWTNPENTKGTEAFSSIVGNNGANDIGTFVPISSVPVFKKWHFLPLT